MPPTDPQNKPLPLTRASKGAEPNPARTPLPASASQLVVRSAEATSDGPPGLSSAPSAGALVHSLRRRCLTAVAVASVGAVAAVVAVLQLVPGKWNAEARVLVSSRGPSNPFDSSESHVDPAIRKNNIKGIIKCAPVLNAALQDPKVANLPGVLGQVDPAAWLGNALKIEFDGSEIVRIMMSGQDPEEARVLANAVADAYVKDADLKERVRRQALLEQMDASYTRMQIDLQDKRRDLQALLKQRNVDDLDTAKVKYEMATRRLDLTLKKASDLNQLESSLLGQIRARRDEEDRIKNQDLPDTLMDRYLRQDVVFGHYLIELNKAREKIRDKASRLAPGAPPHLLAPLHQDRDAILKEMASYRQAQLPHVREQALLETRLEVEKLQRELVGLREQQKGLSEQIKREEEEVRKMVPSNRQSMPDIEALRGSITLAETSLGRLGDKLEALRLAQNVANNAPAGFTSGVMPLQRAELPQQLDRGKQLKVAGGAGVGVFGMLLLGVALLEFRLRKINAADEVVRGLGINLVGTLPVLPARARRALPAQASKKELYYQSLMAESMDAIRTVLLHTARADDLQVIMVTSAGGGEGKTSLASHLAASLARAWRKTLLVDGDLRNPACHRLFDLPLEPGFSEVLRGEVGLNDAVRPTAMSRLWMMPAGHWDSHAVQAMAQEGVRSMFDQLKEQYDFIVVDSCPVLPVADSLLLGQHVDAVVFSVLRDVSRGPAVYTAQQRLSALGVRILGAVVIGASSETDGANYVYPGIPARR